MYFKKIQAVVELVVLMAIAGTIYSLSKNEETVSERKVYLIKNKSIIEIAEIIEKNYSVEVYFDNEPVANRHFWGRIDTRKPLEDFLEDLHLNNGVEYSFDKDRNIHFH